MTSIGSISKQVPLNNGYYRVVPSLLTSPNTVPVSSFMYTMTNGVLGPYTPQSAAVQLQLSTGQCLLKDMGVNFISSSTAGTAQPQIFRRVQLINTAAGAATNGVGGSFTGSDSDYDCAYIAMGFSGALPSAGLGPFIRTG